MTQPLTLATAGQDAEPTPTVWSGGEMLLGISGKFTATHNCPEGGNPHDHEWHVTAWFKNNFRSDARCYLAMIDTLLARLDGTFLPNDLSWGEDIARQLAITVNCMEVEVSRPVDRIHARWRWADTPDRGCAPTPSPSSPPLTNTGEQS